MTESITDLRPEFALTRRAISLPDSSVDAVFAAQAFHWFDNDRSLAESAASYGGRRRG